MEVCHLQEMLEETGQPTGEKMKRVIKVKGKSGNDSFEAVVKVASTQRLTSGEFESVVDSIRNDLFSVARKNHGYSFGFNCHEIKTK